MFAFELYKSLSDSEINIALSPFSVSSCMGMVSIAAEGETLKQIQQILHFPKHPMMVDFGFKALNESLKTGVAAELEPLHLLPTNAIWTQQGILVAPSIFTKIIHYWDGIHQTDFQNDPEGSRASINRYVEEKTLGHIEEFMPKETINSDTRMVAVNTLYFSAPWQIPFKEGMTREGTFQGQEKECLVSYMKRTGQMNQVETELFQMVEIPFKASLSTDTNASLYLLLPRESVSLEMVEEHLNAKVFFQALKKMESKSVTLKFPKFNLESTTLLKPTLMQMGLTLPFSPEGGFPYGKEGSEKMVLTEVVHTVKAEFNEWGATCAAATGASMGLTSFPYEDGEPIAFTCNRPFMFVLADKNTKSILFIGKLAQPN